MSETISIKPPVDPRLPARPRELFPVKPFEPKPSREQPDLFNRGSIAEKSAAPEPVFEYPSFFSPEAVTERAARQILSLFEGIDAAKVYDLTGAVPTGPRARIQSLSVGECVALPQPLTAVDVEPSTSLITLEQASFGLLDLESINSAPRQRVESVVEPEAVQKTTQEKPPARIMPAIPTRRYAEAHGLGLLPSGKSADMDPEERQRIIKEGQQAISLREAEVRRYRRHCRSPRNLLRQAGNKLYRNKMAPGKERFPIPEMKPKKPSLIKTFSLRSPKASLYTYKTAKQNRQAILDLRNKEAQVAKEEERAKSRAAKQRSKQMKRSLPGHVTAGKVFASLLALNAGVFAIQKEIIDSGPEPTSIITADLTK